MLMFPKLAPVLATGGIHTTEVVVVEGLCWWIDALSAGENL